MKNFNSFKRQKLYKLSVPLFFWNLINLFIINIGIVELIDTSRNRCALIIDTFASIMIIKQVSIIKEQIFQSQNKEVLLPFPHARTSQPHARIAPYSVYESINN